MPKEKKVCPIHGVPLTYARKDKTYFCRDCLYSSFLTQRAQEESEKRYRQSPKGKASAKKYEVSEKGKKAREKYLKSPKYKQRRREYNQRLKESLQIARTAMLERATKEKVEEKLRTDAYMPLIQDIREYIDTMGKLPLPSEVIRWAKDVYKINLPHIKATGLITKAEKRH